MAGKLDHLDALPADRAGRALLGITKAFAVIGGLLLTTVVLVTTVSVIGRYFFGAPIPGDYEIVGIGCGIAILLFFPYCEMTDGNIKASFFTDGLRDFWQGILNILAEFLFLGVSALLAWRFVIGGMRRFSDGQSYMYLKIPIWWAYIPGTIAISLLVVVCGYKIYEHACRFKERA